MYVSSWRARAWRRSVVALAVLASVPLLVLMAYPALAASSVGGSTLSGADARVPASPGPSFAAPRATPEPPITEPEAPQPEPVAAPAPNAPAAPRPINTIDGPCTECGRTMRTGQQQDEETGSAPAAESATPMTHLPPLSGWSAGVGLGALVLVVLLRGAAAAAVLGRLAVSLGFRLDRETVVGHPVRATMLAYLERHPGATTAELADVAGVAVARAAYHLAILEREDALRSRRVEGARRFFPMSAPRIDEAVLQARSLARPTRTPGRLLVYLRRAAGASVSDVGRALGISAGHAHYHLERLASTGLVYRVKEGRRVRHYLTHTGQEQLRAWDQVIPSVRSVDGAA